MADEGAARSAGAMVVYSEGVEACVARAAQVAGSVHGVARSVGAMEASMVGVGGDARVVRSAVD